MTRDFAALHAEADYWVPLLALLVDLPVGLTKSQVLEEFERRYGSLIDSQERQVWPARHLASWQVKVEWSAVHLADRRLLEVQSNRWVITNAGLEWLVAHPGATRLDVGQQVYPVRVRPGPPRSNARTEQPSSVSSHPRVVPTESTPARISPVAAVPPASQAAHVKGRTELRCTVQGVRLHLTREHLLGVAKKALADGLPPEARRFNKWAVLIDGRLIGLTWLFHEATGLSGVQLNQARFVFERLGITPVKAVDRPQEPNVRHDAADDSPVSQSPLPGALGEAEGIRAFLLGKAERPSDERLCDQVLFSYAVGMYDEACRLFRLVDGRNVNEWYYRKTKKVAEACEMRMRYA